MKSPVKRTQDRNSETRRQLIRSSLFICIALIAIIIIGIIPLKYYITAQEFYNIKDVISLQKCSNETILFGPGYTNPTAEYKIQGLMQANASIFVVGTSRMMMIPKEFFINQSQFYNAAGLMYYPQDLLAFLKIVSKYHNPNVEQPVVIVGLDQYLFNDIWIDSHPVPQDRTQSFFVQLDQFRQNAIAIIQQIITNKDISLNLLKSKHNAIGIRAKTSDDGFVLDGSAYYGNTETAQEKTNISREGLNFDYTQASVDHGTGPFMHGSQISNNTLAILEEALKYAQANNITVIGILPAHAHIIWKQLENNSNYTYLQNLYTVLKDTFTSYNATIYDYSDVSWVNATDCEMIDGHHTTPKSMARIFVDAASKDKTLNNIVATQILTNAINKSYSCVRISYTD